MNDSLRNMAGGGQTTPHHSPKFFGASLAVGLTIAACLVPAAAIAQTSEMQLPSLRQDRGLRSGDFLLVPSISLSGHHDTNVFNGNEEENGNDPVSATSLRFAPKLGLTNGVEAETQFNFDATGDIRIYVSDDAALTNLNNIGGVAALSVSFAARRAISFTVFDTFSRDLRANNWETLQTLNRNANNIGARVSFHPGDIPSRRPFELTLAGSYAVDRFSEYRLGDTDTIKTKLAAAWRFLPKTAAILDATWDFRSYANANTLQLTADSKPWRVQAGLVGALTKLVTLRVTGGWGMSLHDERDSFNGFVAAVGLGYKASQSTLLHLQYTHDFADAFYGNYVEFHRGTLKLSQRFGQILDVTAHGGFGYGVYGLYNPVETGATGLPVFGSISQANRKDYTLDAGLDANFELARLVSVQVGYRVRGVFTSFKVTAVDASVLDVGAYTAHEIQAGVTLRY